MQVSKVLKGSFPLDKLSKLLTVEWLSIGSKRVTHQVSR